MIAALALTVAGATLVGLAEWARLTRHRLRSLRALPTGGAR